MHAVSTNQIADILHYNDKFENLIFLIIERQQVSI